MTATVRTMSSDELNAVRSDGQYTKLRAVVIPQQTVFSFRCSGSIASNDAVQYIPIGTILSGSSTRVMNGMTCYVGSGSALSDLGMVRAKSVTGNNLKIGRVSGITWSSDVYITVVDDFGIWAKLPTLDLTTIKMDDDIAYTNQNSSIYPVPIMGPDSAIPYTSGSVALDASNSYCLDGSTISTWSWSVINGSAVSGSIISSGSGFATFNFPAPGSYVVNLTITASNGKSATGHRNIYVYDDANYKPLEMVDISTMTGSRDNGGWAAEVTVYDPIGAITCRERAKVILLSDDYYGGSAVKMGQVSGRENLLMVGWISDEVIEYNKEQSQVTFTLQGPAYWLQKCTGPSTFLESVVGTPDAWTSLNNLTMDKIIHHFLYWRSTAIEVMDVYPSNNTRIIGGMSASIGSIWSQVYDTAITRMLTYICCDRFGRFFSFMDPQILASGSRSGIQTIIDIGQNDCAGTVTINRTTVDPVSLLEVAGLCQSGSAVLMYMSRAPGSLIYNRWGDNDINDRLVVTSQADANLLAGMLLAKKNNEFGSVEFSLGQNNKMLDIAPAMYITFTLAASDTNRGISFSNKKMLLKSIEYRFNGEKGTVEMNIDCEGETIGIDGYTVEVPQEPIYNFPTTEINVGDVDFPAIPDLNIPVIDLTPANLTPEPFPIEETDCPLDAPLNGPYEIFFNPEYRYNDDPNSLIAPLGATYRTRPSTADHKTIYILYGDFQEYTPAAGSGGISYHSGSGAYTANDTFYHVYGLDENYNRVIEGTHAAVSGSASRYGYFSGSASVDITYIEVAMDYASLHPDLITQSGSSAAYYGTQAYHTGSFVTGYVAGGAWAQVKNARSDGTNYKYLNSPPGIIFKASGSSSDADYYGSWFTMYFKFKCRVLYSGAEIGHYIDGIETAIAAPSAKWSVNKLKTEEVPATTKTIYTFGERIIPPSTEKLYYMSGGATFQHTGGNYSQVRTISALLDWQGELTSGVSGSVLWDNFYVLVKRAATKRIRIKTATIHNICEAT